MYCMNVIMLCYSYVLVVLLLSIVVLRKLVVFGVTELDKHERASAFMKLVFERLEQFLNASTYCLCAHCQYDTLSYATWLLLNFCFSL